MRRFVIANALAIVTLLMAPAVGAEPASVPTYVVVATRLPESQDSVPAMVSVVPGEELRARGVRDLRTALALIAGVDVAPGGDSGPAGSVPALWGLREFDAFLLVVDGVPYGGAFNPALTTLNLDGVERIEVMRGAAPVTFGATSFVGVINVIHYAAGKGPGRVYLSSGTIDTVRGGASMPLPHLGLIEHSISLDGAFNGFSQDRSKVLRIHGLYRAAAETAAGNLHLDLEGTVLRQDPYSPHPREGATLSPRFPLDANINPADARENQDRLQINLGFETEFGALQWATLVSAAYTNSRNTRGFLREDFSADGITPNADGFRQGVHTTDVYVNSYVAGKPFETVTLILGLDWLFGEGRQRSDNFEYAILPSGLDPPDSHALPTDESTLLDDRRNFGGLYTQVDWQPTPRLDISGGVRLNYTAEDRSGSETDRTVPGDPITSDSEERNLTRVSGVIGASFALWQDGVDNVTVFGDYRNAYKPAAIDFGPEAEAEILEPETAESFEGGIKGRLADGRFEWEASYFHMNFKNLVIRENVDGLPALANAGAERFTGAEFECRVYVTDDLVAAATYAYHDAEFTDYARLNAGMLQQLAGNKIELSPQHLAALGVFYMPDEGLQASFVWNHIGSRFLNKTNTSTAVAYNTIDAGLGYRVGYITLRVDGTNLTDRRDPVAESELGDAQFYRLSGRSVLATIDVNI